MLAIFKKLETFFSEYMVNAKISFFCIFIVALLYVAGGVLFYLFFIVLSVVFDFFGLVFFSEIEIEKLSGYVALLFVLGKSKFIIEHVCNLIKTLEEKNAC
jgi:hypothetical protein